MTEQRPTHNQATDTSAIDLSERRQHILSMVVREYVASAQPVGSRSLADSLQLGVSPATIRNDLAALEQAGLLTHPHTSAGRVPTEMGYRYFVRHLLTEPHLPPGEQLTIRHQFHQTPPELDQWLRLSTAVLAQASHGAAVATGLRAAHSHFKHLELIAIREATVLMVLVLQDGTVKQQLLTLASTASQDELSRLSNELNDQLAGAPVTTISEIIADVTEDGAPRLSILAQEVAQLAAEQMVRVDGQGSNPLYRDGLAQVLAAPEFAEGDNVRRIVQVFEQRAILEEVLNECRTLSDVQVYIAGEGRFSELADISLVVSPYGVQDHATGVLGVIGPLRMAYGRNMGAVRYVSALMSEMVREIYGLGVGE